MSFKSVLQRKAIKELKINHNIRKRFLVSEGDLFQLYKEITAIRNKEDRKRLYEDFKTLMREAQEVELKKKGGRDER